jgi:hypothetical protein
MPNSPSSVDPTTGDCTKCGQVHTKCHAHNRKGQACGLPPIRGANVCGTHGGRAPQVRVAAMRRLARAEGERVAQSIADVDVPTGGDPIEALLRLVDEMTAFKDFLADRVAELGLELYHLDGNDRERLRVHVELYERALDRCGKFLVLIGRLNLEERLTRIQEDLARSLETALLVTLEELGYRDDDHARAVLATQLRVIDGGLPA